MSELQTGNLKKIVRQGDREVIVTLYEFPFVWSLLKYEIQKELNLPIENTFKVMKKNKVLVWVAGGK